MARTSTSAVSRTTCSPRRISTQGRRGEESKALGAQLRALVAAATLNGSGLASANSTWLPDLTHGSATPMIQT